MSTPTASTNDCRQDGWRMWSRKRHVTPVLGYETFWAKEDEAGERKRTSL